MSVGRVAGYAMSKDLHDIEVRGDEKETEIWLASDRPTGLFHIRSLDVKEADEIGTDEFPKYGEFLPVGKGQTAGYLQLTAYLIDYLQDEEAEEGDQFRVNEVVQYEDGGYFWDCTPVVDP